MAGDGHHDPTDTVSADFASGASGPMPPRADRPPDLGPGDSVARYTLQALVGEGAMGRVFAAHDSQLGRTVALKVIRREHQTPVRRARLVREAQALARLSHPNVVTVYDVGSAGDHVFVAMELVQGTTLASWLAEAPRSWREVVGVFLDAGRGLEAAHAAGIIHRDFKPDNVILGDRARVADFGLARAAGAGDGDEADSGSSLDQPMTLTGQRVGTPAYMAPEQRVRGIATAASDQFSYGVALFEALHGARPGEGSARRPVPAWLQRIVDRALAPDPADRYATMGALLADLGRDRMRTRRRWATAAAMVLVAGAALGTKSLLAPAPCAADDAAAALWTAETRARVADAFAKTGRPYAADTFARVDQTLRRRLAAWTQGRRAACEATHVRHEQSEALLDLRMRCLGRVRDAAAQAIGLLADADEDSVDRAVAAADKIADTLPCEDTAALSAMVPPPTDPAVAREDGEMRLEADRARALVSLGRFDKGTAAIRALVERARDFPHAPTRAAVLRAATTIELTAGDVDRAIAHGYEGVRVAESARDDATRAELLSRLVFALGYKRLRHAEADALARLAEGALDRAGNRLDLSFLFTFSRGADLEQKGDYAGALWHAIANLGFAARLGGWPSSVVSTALGDLAEVQRDLGQYRAALAASREATRVAEASLGPEHPMVATRLSVEGETAVFVGALDVADRAHSRQLAIYEAAYGPSHAMVGFTLNQLADVRLHAGRLEDARAFAQRAQGILGPLGPDEPFGKILEVTLGEIDWKLGHLADARARLERAVETSRRVEGPTSRLEALVGAFELDAGRPAAARARLESAISDLTKRLGPDHPTVGAARVDLAAALLAENRPREAIPLCERGLAAITGGLGDGCATTVRALTICARAQLAAGDLSAARALAERAERDAAAPSIDARTASAARFRLGEVQARAGDARACATVRDARALAAGLPFAPERDEMDRFLAERRCR